MRRLRKKYHSNEFLIIFRYQEKINQNQKEYEKSKSRMEDVNSTFELNKEIVIKMFFDRYSSYDLESKDTIFQLNRENSIYMTRNADLFKENRNYEKEIFKLINELEQKKNKEEACLKNSASTKIQLNKKIKEKEFQIEKLKTDIEKLVSIKETKFKKNVFLTHATMTNLETYLELIHTREIVNKLNKNIETDAIMNKKIENELNLIQSEVENYKISNGILIESSSEPKINSESCNQLYSEESEFFDSIDISRYNKILKEKDFLKFEEFTDEIQFLDKVCMKKVGDVIIKKLNLGKIQNKYNNFKIVEKKNEENNIEKKLKDPIKLDVNKLDDAEAELIKKIKEAEIELSQTDQKIFELSEKNLKYTISIKEFQSKIRRLKENIKVADCKIMLLRNQIWENSEKKLSDYEDDENIFRTQSEDDSDDS